MQLPNLFSSKNALPRTHNALVDHYQFSFREAVRRGEQEPYVWPYRNFGGFVLIAYLLLPPTRSRIVHLAFYPIFAYFVWDCVRAINETKSASLAVSYGIGIVNSWGILWLAARTFYTDFRSAKRIEKRTTKEASNGHITAPDSAKSSGRKDTKQASKRKKDEKPKKDEKAMEKKSSGTKSQYYWQTFPSKFVDRVPFVMDLLFSMRGPGWEHQARSIPGPPEHIAAELDPKPPTTRPATKAYKDKKSVLWRNAIRVVQFQLFLDFLKTLMMHDPYFLGFVDGPPPAPAFFPKVIRGSPVLTRCYRVLVGMIATRTSLAMIFCLSPLFFSGVLGSRIMGLRAESWYYSDFGGDWRYLLSDGIAGWWGAWWHQIFRLGFEAPSKWILKHTGISPRSPQAKIISVFVAFLCSGLLHAAGSISLLPDTHPWSGPFKFFMLQIVGTIIESTVSQLFRSIGITQRLPKFVKNIIVIAWLGIWAYYTGPILIDDFCRGGIWLFEPAPISPLTFLGFREPGDHFWRWKGRNVFWHTGDKWWKSGIAV